MVCSIFFLKCTNFPKRINNLYPKHQTQSKWICGHCVRSINGLRVRNGHRAGREEQRLQAPAPVQTSGTRSRGAEQGLEEESTGSRATVGAAHVLWFTPERPGVHRQWLCGFSTRGASKVTELRLRLVSSPREQWIRLLFYPNLTLSPDHSTFSGGVRWLF